MSRIVLLSPAHPLRGGIAASTERLAQTFMEQDHEVVIVSFRLQYPSFLFPGKTQYTTDAPPKDLKIITLINSVNPLNWIFTFFQLLKLKPDFVLSRFWLPFMGPSLGTIQYLVKIFTKAKIVGIVDNAIPHEKRFGDGFFTQYYLKSCHSFVALSSAVEKDLMKLTTKKIVATEHPLYDHYGEKMDKTLARQHLNITDQNIKLILFFGFIREYKGLDLLLEAVAAIKDPNIRILIAGEYYGNQGFYEDLYKSLNLNNILYLHTDYIPNEAVKYYFSAADVVVQPYKSATQSGISQIAYYFEKPMIVTNVGALPDTVADGITGLIVEPNAISLAKAIQKYFDQNLEPQMTDQCAIYKKRFSWESLCDSIFNSVKN